MGKETGSGFSQESLHHRTNQDNEIIPKPTQPTYADKLRINFLTLFRRPENERSGRLKRNEMEAEDPEAICPLCQRPLGERWNRHHLIPRTFKGKEIVNLHLICHHKIHSVFTERELLNYYHTIERLQEHEEIARFIAWVANKEPNYYDRTRKLKR